MRTDGYNNNRGNGFGGIRRSGNSTGRSYNNNNHNQQYGNNKMTAGTDRDNNDDDIIDAKNLQDEETHHVAADSPVRD